MPKLMDALKEFNKTKENWCVPRKGTDDYKKLMALMNPAPALPEPRRSSRVRKAKVLN